jgi:hypothetical protein
MVKPEQEPDQSNHFEGENRKMFEVTNLKNTVQSYNANYNPCKCVQKLRYSLIRDKVI